MTSPQIEKLRLRVQEVSEELFGLRHRLEQELEEKRLMEEENLRARRILRRHEELLAERRRLKEKIRHLLDRLDTLPLP